MSSAKSNRISLRDLCVFAMFGALMFASTLALSSIPNVHLLGLLIMALTVVYRVRALIPLYLYVLLQGVSLGFSVWWIPYLYVWTVLWGVTMLIPRTLPNKVLAVLYPAVCGLFGLAFGTIWAPAQAILFGLNGKQMLAWIANGLAFDAIHGASNLCLGCLVLPLSAVLDRLAGHPAKKRLPDGVQNPPRKDGFRDAEEHGTDSEHRAL